MCKDGSGEVGNQSSENELDFCQSTELKSIRLSQSAIEARYLPWRAIDSGGRRGTTCSRHSGYVNRKSVWILDLTVSNGNSTKQCATPQRPSLFDYYRQMSALEKYGVRRRRKNERWRCPGPVMPPATNDVPSPNRSCIVGLRVSVSATT